MFVSNNRDLTADFLGFIELGADQTWQAITDGLMKLFYDAGLDKQMTNCVAVCTSGLLLILVCTTALCQNYRIWFL